MTASARARMQRLVVRLLSTSPQQNAQKRSEDVKEDTAKLKEGEGSVVSSDSSSTPPESQYWREDYKTTFTTEELLKKEKESKALEERTSIIDRIVSGLKSGAISIKNLTISVGQGAITLLMNPTRIPGATLNAWKHIKEEAYHYWIGFKLMGKNIATATSILLTALDGKRLTRRERRMLRRTAVDIFRLVPFSIFIIIPFMEFLLPVALRLFPNMLPSSFNKSHEKEDKLKKDLQARLQIASFLSETVDELAKSKLSESKKEDIMELLAMVRKGHRISNEQILNVASVFSDELTLETMHRPQLVSLCQYMGLRPFGSNPHLRWVLSQKMQKLREDDELIRKEGVESLTFDELRTALQERGMRTVGLTTRGYRKNLEEWLTLSLDKEVPHSLLFLSRAFTILETRKAEDALQATLSSMEEDTIEEILFSAGEEMDAATKLEVLERQNEMISEESQERAEREERRRKIAEAKAQEAEEKGKEKEKDQETLIEPKIEKQKEKVETILQAKEIVQMTPEEAAKAVRADTVVIPDKVLEEAVEDLEALLEHQAVQEERDVLEQLKRELEARKGPPAEELSPEVDPEEMIAKAEVISEEIAEKLSSEVEAVLAEDLQQAEEEDEKAKQREDELARTNDIADRLKTRVEKMLSNIEKRIEDADKQMETLNILDADGDGLITEAELVHAIKDVLSEHNTEEEAQAIAKEVLDRAADKMHIGVSTKELIHLAHELRSRNFKPVEEAQADEEMNADKETTDEASGETTSSTKSS